MTVSTRACRGRAASPNISKARDARAGLLGSRPPAPVQTASRALVFPAKSLKLAGKASQLNLAGNSTTRWENHCTESYLHRESVSGQAGFRLGFVYRSARWAGSGLCQSASILYHLITARGLGSGARSVSENSDMKFEFAVQDAIKTPQAKARLSRDTFAMSMTRPASRGRGL